MDKNDANVLLIFIKNPVKGHVKTRLASSIGQTKALHVYHTLLKITKEITVDLNCERQVWYSKFVDPEDIWDSSSYSKYTQQGDDLGKRMKFAFEHAFGSGYQKVLIIGSDCADLSSDIINQAFDALSENNVVIGPSLDGGYYLLGMSQFYPLLLDEISWSEATVFEETLNKAINNDFSYYVLPVLNDIDDITDLQNSKNITL
jgi:hypothetical protein